MARLGISGFACRFEIKESKKKESTISTYGVLDLLQIGASDYGSSLLNIIVHDRELIDYIVKNYNLGTMIPFAGVIEFVKMKTDHMWVLKKITKTGTNVLKEVDYGGE